MKCRTVIENLAIFPNGELGITWGDGHESYYPGRDLRLACTCARCVDEDTGQKLLHSGLLPQDVHPVEAVPVGNYGITILWSDRHGSGIYTLERLRALCPCDQCRTRSEASS